MAPKKRRCSGVDCAAKVGMENSVVVADLPGLVKKYLLEKCEYTEESVLCYPCVAGAAPDWGFPRDLDSAIRTGMPVERENGPFLGPAATVRKRNSHALLACLDQEEGRCVRL